VSPRETDIETDSLLQKRKRPDSANALPGLALPLLGSNQDSPDPESLLTDVNQRQFVGLRGRTEHRCRLSPNRNRQDDGRNGHRNGLTPRAWLGVGLKRATPESLELADGQRTPIAVHVVFAIGPRCARRRRRRTMDHPVLRRRYARRYSSGDSAVRTATALRPQTRAGKLIISKTVAK
jgi:hypothetical protein